MPHFQELCRLCAQMKRNRIEIFKSDEMEKLLSKIWLCLSVQITNDDLLPKIICIDCQRSIDQICTFRHKCQKAEERLIKMLNMMSPEKFLCIRIKEEGVEGDYQKSSVAPKRDLFKQVDQDSCSKLKLIENVKAEMEEEEEDTITPQYTDPNSDLIQIISEEILSCQKREKLTQPQIEIISESFMNENKEIVSDKTESCNFYEEENDDNTFKDKPNENVTDDFFGMVTMDDVETVNDCPVSVPYLSKCNSINTTLLITEPSWMNTEVYYINSDRSIIESKNINQVSNHNISDGSKLDGSENIETKAVAPKKENDHLYEKPYCNQCRKTFKFLKSYHKHMRLHEEEPPFFVCDFCSNSNNSSNHKFSTLKYLKYHIKRKHLYSARQFKCHICCEALPTQKQLDYHIEKIHNNVGFCCGVCRKFLKNKIKLRQHMKVHQEKRPYMCEECGQSFKWSSGLKVHLQSHNQEKNFLCSECGKKFAAKKNLNEHLNIHRGKRPYVCKHCSASFVHFSAYSKHLFIHNEDMKVYKCESCEKSFSHRYILKQHTLQHLYIRPYVCSTCQLAFKTQSDLCSHVKVHQEKQYCCRICEKKFSRTQTLKDHMVTHTGVKHVCPAPGCGKSYTQRFPLTKHFSNNHPSLVLINRVGGRKTHLGENCVDKKTDSEQNFIQYDCLAK